MADTARSATALAVKHPVREIARVVRQEEEAPGYYRLRLNAPTVAQCAHAGQFVHVLPRMTGSGALNSTFDPLLRRAFSIMSADGDEIEILYRAGGRGTNLMARWRAGESIDLLGPLGTGFGTFAQHNILVGGGVGVPPLVMLAARAKREHANIEEANIIAFIGARSSSDVLCSADFAALSMPVEVATEDGSQGETGRVTLLLERSIKAHLNEIVSRETISDFGIKVFSCGPLPMLRAVAQMCARYGIECEVSLEEAMPCGIGVCNGCVVPVISGSDDYGQYRRICVEGPVLKGHDVDWERA